MTLIVDIHKTYVVSIISNEDCPGKIPEILSAPALFGIADMLFICNPGQIRRKRPTEDERDFNSSNQR